MALAPYFQRSAVAAAHALQGYDEEALGRRLEGLTVGMTCGASQSGEAPVLREMLLQLLARLYPRLSLRGPAAVVEPLGELATRINPHIEVVASVPDVEVLVGGGEPRAQTSIFATSAGWVGHVSRSPLPEPATTNNPFGAAAAACLTAANIFRAVLLPDGGESLDDDVAFSVEERAQVFETPAPRDLEAVQVTESDVLVGAGAIGTTVAWILTRTPLIGSLTAVDPEAIDIGNLQRYVGTEMSDAQAEDARTSGAPKVELVERQLSEHIDVAAVRGEWADLVETRGHVWNRVLVGVDSARARRSIQSTLPRWIANAWTQPGDLGLSVHPRFGEGACVRCLYLPEAELPSEDELIAAALGLDIDQHGLQLRQLLYTGEPCPAGLLDVVSASRDIPRSELEPYESLPLRDLYVEGVCGGAVIPLSRVESAPQEVHVPLAHQSAMAGVLLAAALVLSEAANTPTVSEVTRMDLMRPLGEYLTLPAQQDPTGRCICQDRDYVDAYRHKYE